MHIVPSSPINLFISLIVTIITFVLHENYLNVIVIIDNALSMADKNNNFFKIVWKLSEKSFYPLFSIPCQNEIGI